MVFLEELLDVDYRTTDVGMPAQAPRDGLMPEGDGKWDSGRLGPSLAVPAGATWQAGAQ